MSSDVFFFGSGFSKSLINSYPTLNELSNYIKSEFQYEKESVHRHFMHEVPDKFHDNIETLLTYLSSNLPYKTPVQVSADEALYKDITSKLAKKFQELRQEHEVNANEQSIKQFARYILDNKCTCITLNYDLILEDLLYKNTPQEYQDANKNFSIFYKIPITNLQNRIPVSYGGYASFNTDFDRAQMPEIIKLHGSINWLYSGLSMSDPVYSETGDEANYLKSGLINFIVPPVLDKQSQYNNVIIKSLWTKAFNAIENAHNIYIYGFSFPQTDYSIRFLFQSALRNNPNCKIYVVNTDSNLEALKSHYIEIFGEHNCNFDCCVGNNQLGALINILQGGQND